MIDQYKPNYIFLFYFIGNFNDSDLFFDFDIESPDTPENGEPQIVNCTDTEKYGSRTETCKGSKINEFVTMKMMQLIFHFSMF